MFVVVFAFVSTLGVSVATFNMFAVLPGPFVVCADTPNSVVLSSFDAY